MPDSTLHLYILTGASRGMGLAMAQALLPRYARAQTISFTDPRIKAILVGTTHWVRATSGSAATGATRTVGTGLAAVPMPPAAVSVIALPT